MTNTQKKAIETAVFELTKIQTGLEEIAVEVKGVQTSNEITFAASKVADALYKLQPLIE